MMILDLPLKRKWYEMIESGIKTEEYREFKDYWVVRLGQKVGINNYGGPHYNFRPFTHVRFRYGYTNRTMLREIESMRIGYGKPEWGAPPGKKVFVIKLKPLCCPSTNC